MSKECVWQLLQLQQQRIFRQHQRTIEIKPPTHRIWKNKSFLLDISIYSTWMFILSLLLKKKKHLGNGIVLSLHESRAQTWKEREKVLIFDPRADRRFRSPATSREKISLDFMSEKIPWVSLFETRSMLVKEKRNISRIINSVDVFEWRTAYSLQWSNHLQNKPSSNGFDCSRQSIKKQEFVAFSLSLLSDRSIHRWVKGDKLVRCEKYHCNHRITVKTSALIVASVDFDQCITSRFSSDSTLDEVIKCFHRSLDRRKYPWSSKWRRLAILRPSR